MTFTLEEYRPAGAHRGLAVLVTSLIAFNVIEPSLRLAIGLAIALLISDVVGWQVVAPMFDRERLVTGSR